MYRQKIFRRLIFTDIYIDLLQFSEDLSWSSSNFYLFGAYFTQTFHPLGDGLSSGCAHQPAM